MSSPLFSIGGVPSSCADSMEIISTPSSLRMAVIEEVDSEGVSTPSFTSSKLIQSFPPLIPHRSRLLHPHHRLMRFCSPLEGENSGCCLFHGRLIQVQSTNRNHSQLLSPRTLVQRRSRRLQTLLIFLSSPLFLLTRYSEKSVTDHCMSRCYCDVNKTNKADRL